jgi:hypothetical protein
VGGYCSHCRVLRAKELSEAGEPESAMPGRRNPHPRGHE